MGGEVLVIPYCFAISGVISLRTSFAILKRSFVPQTPIARCFAIVSRPWCAQGFFCLAVRPRMLRRGTWREVMVSTRASLKRWGTMKAYWSAGVGQQGQANSILFVVREFRIYSRFSGSQRALYSSRRPAKAGSSLAYLENDTEVERSSATRLLIALLHL